MTGRASPPGPPRRFNVVELVLILTTLATLASLLLPVLSRGTHLARSGVCAENQRKLAVWLSMYSHSYDDFLPAYEDGWVRLTAAAAGRQVDPAVAPRAEFACPSQSFVTVAGVQEPAAYWRGSYYGLNQHIASSLRDEQGRYFPQWSQVKVKAVKDPSGKVLLADSSGSNYFEMPDRDPAVAGLERAGHNYTAGLPPEPLPPLPFLRHLDGSGNFAFLDGHAEVKRSYPEFMLGPGTPGYEFWFGEHAYPGSGLEPAGGGGREVRP